MSVDDIYKGMQRLRERLEEKLRHPYVIRHIDLPFIDEEKMLLLYSLLYSANLPIDEIEHYALTIMLVQIALDTHEKVSDNKELESHKKRQLTALAGDYYSGLYYYLLAEQRDIMLIRVLARGIEQINEEKVALYREGGKTITGLIKSIALIESTLLQKACDHFGVSAWKPFVSAATALKRMEREYTQYEQSQQVSFLLENIKEQTPSQVYEACIQKIRLEVQQIAQGNEQLIKTMKMLNI